MERRHAADMSGRIACIRGFMTRCPHTVDADLLLSRARERMRELDVRHFPVVQHDRLVGMLSDRDAALAEALGDRGDNVEDLRVRDAMTPDPFTCTADAHLHAVAEEMAQSKRTCAIVLDEAHPTKVVGVFTTTDALLALSLLAPQE
jgi:CBS-domain-containing membrane protein